MKERIILGIDPDTEKSGVAKLHLDGHGNHALSLFRMTFPELMDFLRAFSELGQTESITVVVERGWFTTTNYHLRFDRGQRFASRQGVDIGRNHETGRKIVEMARHYGLDVTEMNPLPKKWSGKDGKITKEELESFTGPLPRCSQDERDAALLAWVHAGLPVSVRVSHKMEV